jgi:hypothetical protein
MINPDPKVRWLVAGSHPPASLLNPRLRCRCRRQTKGRAPTRVQHHPRRLTTTYLRKSSLPRPTPARSPPVGPRGRNGPREGALGHQNGRGFWDKADEGHLRQQVDPGRSSHHHPRPSPETPAWERRGRKSSFERSRSRSPDPGRAVTDGTSERATGPRLETAGMHGENSVWGCRRERRSPTAARACAGAGLPIGSCHGGDAPTE